MKTEQATFAGGCFWCTHALFEQLRGVQSVVSGYIGGDVPHPTYEQVCTGQTGHVEAIDITFDPREIGFATLVEIFMLTHDPTTQNRQGHDVGTQYRSVIFYHSPQQRQTAQQVIARLSSENMYHNPIVTLLQPAAVFYPAEAYHQAYYQENVDAGYCQVVISPKLSTLRQQFAKYIKP